MSDPEATRRETGARALGDESAERGAAPAEPGDPGGEAPATSDPVQLRRDIEETRAELGDTVEALSRKADVKAQLSQKLEQRKARLEARKAALRARQEELRAKAAGIRERSAAGIPEGGQGTTSQLVRSAEERPIPAIGVAFGVGFVLAWLIRRR
jgi:ElaB/YqjD/DUF883 family membrane-anchored ribosome-binding protein